MFAAMLTLVTAATMLAGFQLSRLHFDSDFNALIGRDDPVVQIFDELAEKSRGHDALLVICPGDFSLTPQFYDRLLEIRGVETSLPAIRREGASSIYPFSLGGDPANIARMTPVVEAFNSAIAEDNNGCGLTGTPAIFVESQNILRHDQRRALALTLILVLLLFGGLYRIGWLALLMLVPVAVGITWGLALYSLLRTELTLLAATVPALLIGIGIDHCIHLIQGTRHAMGTGLARHEAVSSAWLRLFRPITTSAVTTACAFAILTIADLRGLADLGWSGALTVFGVFVSVMLLMPWLLIVSPQRWLSRPVPMQDRLINLAGSVERHGKQAMLWVVAASAAALIACFWLQPLGDNRALDAPGMQSRLLQNRIAEEHGYTTKPFLLLLEDSQQVEALIGSNKPPDGISTVLPVYGMPELARLHPAMDAFDADNYSQMLGSIGRWLADKGIESWQLGGGPVFNARLTELMAKDARTMLPLIATAILLILALFSRSFKTPLLILLPLLLSLLWLGGFLAVTGTPVSVMSLAIAPLVIGIGVDDGIHFLSSWKRNNGSAGEVFAETGVALVVTTLTTVAAFGSFIAADTVGLVMFGSQAALALGFCLLATLLVLPALCRELYMPASPAPSVDK